MYEEQQSEQPWSLYMLRCNDNSIYTGISNDVIKRVTVQLAGGQRAAKYLKAKKPRSLIFTLELANRAVASRLENRVKKLPKEKKEQLVKGERSIRELLPDFDF